MGSVSEISILGWLAPRQKHHGRRVQQMKAAHFMIAKEQGAGERENQKKEP